MLGSDDNFTESHLRILLVTENKSAEKHICAILKEKGYETVFTTECGLEALKTLAAEPFGFVICGMQTRFIDGWTFIREVKHSEQIANLPMLIFGDQPPATEEELNSYGILGFLKMPCAARDLDFLIASSLRVHRTSGTTEANYTKAKNALIQHDSEQAVELYSELKGESQGSVRSRHGLTQAYIQKEDFNKASEEITELQEVAGEDMSPGSLFLLVDMTVKKGNAKGAKRLAKQLISATKDSPLYYSRVSQIFFKIGEIDYVEELCNEAMVQKFQTPEFHLLAAKLHYKRGKIEEALSLTSEIQLVFGMSKETANLRGICYRRLGQYETAIENYETALKLAPMDPRVYFNLGISWLAINETKRALSCFETCLKVDPGFKKASTKIMEIRYSEDEKAG